MEKREITLDQVEVKVEKDGGVAKVRIENDELFLEKAKEFDLDKEILEKVDKFEKAYVAALANFSVDKAIEIFKEDEKIGVAELEAPLGIHKRDKFTSVIEREKELRIPGKEKKTVIKPHITFKLEIERFVIGDKRRRSLEDKIKKEILGS